MLDHSNEQERENDAARRLSSSLSDCDWVRQSQLLLQRIFFVNDNNNHSAAAHPSSSSSSPPCRPKSANQDVPQPSGTPPLLPLSDHLAVADDAANDDGEDAEVPSFLDFGIQSSGSDDVEEEHADFAAPDALASGVQAREEDHWTLEDNYWYWTRGLRFDFQLLHPALLHDDDEGRTRCQQNGSTSTHESVGSSSSPWTSRRKRSASFAFPATQRAWSSAVLAEGRMRRNNTVDVDDDDGKAVSSKEKGAALCASSPSCPPPPKAVGAVPNGNGNGGSGCTIVSLARERRSSGPLPRREAEEKQDEDDDPGALLLFQHDSIAIKFLLFPLPLSTPQQQQQQQEQQRRERDHEEDDHVDRSNRDGASFEVTRCASLLQEVSLHASLPLDSLHLLPCYGGGVAVLEEQQPQQQDGNVVHHDDSSRVFVQEVSYFCNRGGSSVCGDGVLASSCSSSSSSLSFSLVRADSSFPMMNGIVTMDNDEEEVQRCSAAPHYSTTLEHPSKSSPTKEKEPSKKRRAVIVFLLMEHAGMTLSQRAISRPFRSFHDDAVLRVLKQLSSALGVLSQLRREKQEEDEIKKKNDSSSADDLVPCEDCCQVVHGDLKPQNVYLRSPSAVAFLTTAAAKKKQKKTNFLHKKKICAGEQQCNSYHEMKEGEEEQKEGIICGDEVWALADFGCATRIVKKKKTIPSGSTTNASTDTTLLLLLCPLREAYAGTVLYMSPEVAAGALHRTVQSDIWSLGVLAVWLLTKGELPWAPLERQLPSLLLHQLRDSYLQFHRQLSSQQWHSEKEEQEATTVLGPVLLSTLFEMKSAFVARRKRQEKEEEEKGEGTPQQSMEHATDDREEALVRLIRQCLLMSPPHRPTAAQFYVTLGSLMFCAESGGKGKQQH